jgi:glycosyltransferase involved in cell wall biosynthesis
MRIGISTRGLNQGSFAISTIVYHLTQTILDLASEKHKIYLYFNDPDYETLYPGCNLKRSVKLNNRFLWDHFWLPTQLKKDDVDVALFMKGTMPFYLPCRGAVIIHDLGYFDLELRPYKNFETIYMKKMMAHTARRACKVFADSNYTKQEAIRFLMIDPKDVVVCYQNCSPIYEQGIDQNKLEDIAKRYGLPEQFIFFPTSISPRKNIERVLEAYQHVAVKIQHHLVITGGQSWHVNMKHKIIPEFESRIHRLGSVPIDDMPALYSLASFTLYPSLLEGFGFPILEAFHRGSPVLTSNLTSMPEVAGNAAYLVDPYDVQQIADGILSLSLDQDLCNELVRRGYEQAKNFSWEKTARIILSQLESC